MVLWAPALLDYTNMKKLITFILLLTALTIQAQETPPAFSSTFKQLSTGQLYWDIPTQQLWVYKGSIYGWHKITRWTADAITERDLVIKNGKHLVLQADPNVENGVNTGDILFKNSSGVETARLYYNGSMNGNNFYSSFDGGLTGFQLAKKIDVDLKVDKVTGKSLLSDSEIARLATLSNNIYTAGYGLDLNNNTFSINSNVITTDFAQILNSKTLNSPVINSPTGIVKGDVGLSAVDNTSDATKNSATATLTNKSISGATNTITAIPDAALTSNISKLNATETYSGLKTFSALAKFTGKVQIGSSASASTNVFSSTNLSGSTTSTGFGLSTDMQTDVTAKGIGFSSAIGTATSQIADDIIHFYASQRTFGAGTVITNQAGFKVESTLIGATNNYGFQGSIPAATSRYNLYMNGSAQNYMNGNLGLGVTAPSARLHLGTTAGTAGTAGLKWNTGTLLTATEAGAEEYDGALRYYTNSSGNRKTYVTLDNSQTITNKTFGTNNDWQGNRIGTTYLGAGTPSASNYLRGDGTWATVAAGGTVTSLNDASTNGVSITWANRTTTPTPTISLGAIAPTSVNGVSATTMAFNDATSSIQTQLNSKAATSALASYVPYTGATSSVNLGTQTLTTSGVITAGSFVEGSLRSLKNNIQDITFNPLDVINSVKVQQFTLKSDPTNELKVGFIADDTDPILSTSNHNKMSHGNTLGVLLGGVQMLSAKEIELTNRIKELEQRLMDLETKINGKASE